MKKGKNSDEGKYYDFYQAAMEAEASAHVQAVDVIKSAMTKSWQAAAWWLERKFPEFWSRKENYIPIKKNRVDIDAIQKKSEETPEIAAVLSDLLKKLSSGNPSGPSM